MNSCSWYLRTCSLCSAMAVWTRSVVEQSCTLSTQAISIWGNFFILHQNISGVACPQGHNSHFKKLSKVSIEGAVTHMKDLLNFTFKNISAQVQAGSEGRNESYCFGLNSFALPVSALTIQPGRQQGLSSISLEKSRTENKD